MKGYVTLDYDGNLHHKLYAAVQEDPGFFSRSKDSIVKHWYFDTEDRSNFANMLRQFNDRLVSNSTIRTFLISIDHLKTVANP